MRQPGRHEILFIDPRDDSYWYLPLKQQASENSDSPVSTIDVSALGTFPPKEVQNDWTRANHQVLSSYVQSDTTGGGQIREVDEATDGSRYWFANAWTAHPKMVTLPRRTNSEVEALLGVTPLGDYGGDLMVVAGSLSDRLNTFDASTDTFTEVDTFASTPSIRAAGIAFRGTDADVRFFIVTEGGYEIWDGVALSGTITDADGVNTIAPVAFCEWDGKLYALDTTGKLWESTSGDAASWTEKAALDGRYTPLDLIEFFDRSDEPTLHIVCKEAVFSVDIANNKLYKTKMPEFRHPSDLRPAAVYNTDLYVAGGVAVKKYTGGAVIPVGLDRDYGLPTKYRGEIKALAGFEDGLLALVEYINPVGPVINGALMWWNEDGWHTLWTDEDDPVSIGLLTRIHVSGTNGAWRIYWGDIFKLYWQDINIYQFNPLAGIDEGWEFEETGYIEYGELDFAMTGYKKLLGWVEVRHRNVTATETITISYRLNGSEGAWVELGTIASQPEFGLTRLFLGENGTYPDGGGTRYDGLAANSIQLRADFERDAADPTKSPILASIGVVFHKLMGTLMGYTVDVDGTKDSYGGKTTAEIHQFLKDMIAVGTFIPVHHQGTWHQMRVAGVGGWDEVGVDIKGDRQIALVEVVDEFA